MKNDGELTYPSSTLGWLFEAYEEQTEFARVAHGSPSTEEEVELLREIEGILGYDNGRGKNALSHADEPGARASEPEMEDTEKKLSTCDMLEEVDATDERLRYVWGLNSARSVRRASTEDVEVLRSLPVRMAESGDSNSLEMLGSELRCDCEGVDLSGVVGGILDEEAEGDDGVTKVADGLEDLDILRVVDSRFDPQAPLCPFEGLPD
jgi:hypothetical protein